MVQEVVPSRASFIIHVFQLCALHMSNACLPLFLVMSSIGCFICSSCVCMRVWVGGLAINQTFSIWKKMRKNGWPLR